MRVSTLGLGALLGLVSCPTEAFTLYPSLSPPIIRTQFHAHTHTRTQMHAAALRPFASSSREAMARTRVSMSLSRKEGSLQGGEMMSTATLRRTLLKKRYLFGLVCVTFLLIFRSVALHPLSYGVGFLLAPISLIANAIPFLMLMFFNPFTPFFYIITAPMFIVFATGLMIKFSYTMALEMSVWVGRSPTFVNNVIEPFNAVVGFIHRIPIIRELLGLEGFPDFLLVQAKRAERLYGLRRLNKNQVLERMGALALKGAGSAAVACFRPVTAVGGIPKRLFLWGRAARISAQKRMSEETRTGLWWGRFRQWLTAEERKAMRLSVAAFNAMDKDGDGRLRKEEVAVILDSRLADLLDLQDEKDIASLVTSEDGRVSLNEFLYILQQARTKMSKAKQTSKKNDGDTV